VPVGLALSAGVILIFHAIFPGTEPGSPWFTIGWRIPFYFSAMLIIVGLYIRLRILETPAFTRVKQEGKISHVPVLEVFRHYWREIILSALLRSAEQAPFYIFTTFILSYGVKSLKLSSSLLYTALVITAIFSFVMMPTYSSISDRVGRKRWYMIGCVLMAIWAFPYFLLLQTKIALIVVVAMVLSVSLFHDWLYGPQAALISERFGTRLRYSGASLGYQLASITAGGPAPIIATYLVANSKSLIGAGAPTYTLIAVFIIFMAVVSFISTALLREYAGRAAVEEVGEPAYAASGR
jgi:MFS family permease